MRFGSPPPSEFPPPLSPPAFIEARNTEYNLDLIGRVTHLDEHGLIASFPVEVPEGTVLFTSIDLRSVNSTVRALIRVKSQAEGVELGGYATVAEFVDLNEDERRKIARQLSGEAGLLRGQGMGTDAASPVEVAVSPVAPRPGAALVSPRAGELLDVPAQLHPSLARLNIASLIWMVLGFIFYTCVALSLVAIFPQGRAWELMWFAKVWHAIGPWFRPIIK